MSEKFWTLVRLNKNGNGVPVWAGNKGGVKYRTLDVTMKRATELAAEKKQDIYIMELGAFARQEIRYVPPPFVPPLPVQVVEITAVI